MFRYILHPESNPSVYCFIVPILLHIHRCKLYYRNIFVKAELLSKHRIIVITKSFYWFFNIVLLTLEICFSHKLFFIYFKFQEFYIWFLSSTWAYLAAVFFTFCCSSNLLSKFSFWTVVVADITIVLTNFYLSVCKYCLGVLMTMF